MSRAPLATAALFAAVALLGACRGAAEMKLVELDEILASRNDNDPRLDRDFLALTSRTKSAFRDKYRALPPERRNERGIIVYLLGKNLSAPEDWEFLRVVAGEEPCLSLADCAKAPEGESGPGDAVTLAYPSLVALRQAARAVDEGALRSAALPIFEAAKASRVKAVSRLALSLEPRFDKKAP